MQRLLNENEELEREIEELNNELNSILNRDSKVKKIKVGGTLKRGMFKKKGGVKITKAEGSVKTYKRTKEVFDTFLSGDPKAAKQGAMLLTKLKNPKKYHINSQDSFGETLLMHAVRKNDGGLVQWLLKNGADVNHQDLEGETALMIAAKLGSYELTSMLLETMDEHKVLKRGIDLVMVNSRKTALMQASEKGHTRICSLLMQNGANTEKIDLDGKTARELAKENDHKKAAKALSPKKKQRSVLDDDEDEDDDDDFDVLSEASSDVSNLDDVVDDGKGYKRLSYANDATMAEVKGENERLKDEVQRLKFEIESAKGKRKPDEWQQIKNLAPEERAQLLITDKRPEKIIALVNEFHDLILADKWEKAESKFLVAKNPKITINVPDSYGETALMKAARVGNFDSLELLLTYSAKTNIRDNNGDTALMKAAMHNKLQCAEALIDAGADMNHHTKHKRQTALMLAALRGHQEMCELLITRGCNPFMSDSEGRVAKDLAMNDETREYLEETDDNLKSKRHSTDPEIFT